jgi:hypothetical protein
MSVNGLRKEASMKRTLVLIALLLLTCSLAWAEEPAPGTSAGAPLGGSIASDSGGGCMLPDLTGLSQEQILAAALEAGFQVSPTDVQIPPCPTTFSCTSIPNCGAGTPCTVSIIGQCCKPAGAPPICCANGPIKEKRCPCVCTGSPCAFQCINSTDVKLIC